MKSLFPKQFNCSIKVFISLKVKIQNFEYLFRISWHSILFYYPTAENTIQITVQTYSDIGKVENLFAA